MSEYKNGDAEQSANTNAHVLENATVLIRQLLKEPGELKNVQELARKTGLDYDTVLRYADGTSLPSPEDWQVLKTVLVGPRLGAEEDAGMQLCLDDEDPFSNLPTSDQSRGRDKSTENDSSTNDMHTKNGWSGPEERQEFFLPIHGFVWFYPEEVRVIDHPAFQRLSGMHQLGLAHIVYRGATHRRIEHAMGTVGAAEQILRSLADNSLKFQTAKVYAKDEWIHGHGPTAHEKRFIRLAALLHDIGHVPFGHTFEDELHLLNKHDEPDRLKKILAKEYPEHLRARTLRELIDHEYTKYLPAGLRGYVTPSDLLQRIIVHDSSEKNEDAALPQKAPTEEESKFARSGIRLRICRDIVGNTICADLLDYLHRDWYHIGKPKHFEQRIFHYMEIRTPQYNKNINRKEPPNPTSEDVFVLSIGNQPKLRTDGISAILDLLESRYQLAEGVLFHRTKMIASAMLERAISLSVAQNGKLVLNEKHTSALENWLLDNPEEALLPLLAKDGNLARLEPTTPGEQERYERVKKLASKLLHRDLYQLLLMVNYHELTIQDAPRTQKTFGDSKDAPLNRAKALKELETDFGLPPGSLTMYCPESRMNSKVAMVRLFVNGVVEVFKNYDERTNDHEGLAGGHLKAQLNRFKGLWRIGFFIDPHVAEKNATLLPLLMRAIRVCVLGEYSNEQGPEAAVREIVSQLVTINDFHHYSKKVRDTPLLQVNRAREGNNDLTYPTRVPTISSFIINENA